MRADIRVTSGRSNTLRESETWEKVESKKWKDNNRAAGDRFSRKSRKRKKKKNKERDFRSGSWDPGGGEEGGEGMRCAQGPPGGRSLPPSPLFLSPPPFPPKGGRTPTQLAQSCIDRFQDFKFPLFHHRLFMERMSRLENAFSYSNTIAESFDACPILYIGYETSILCLKLVGLIKL